MSGGEQVHSQTIRISEKMQEEKRRNSLINKCLYLSHSLLSVLALLHVCLAICYINGIHWG